MRFLSALGAHFLLFGSLLSFVGCSPSGTDSKPKSNEEQGEQATLEGEKQNSTNMGSAEGRLPLDLSLPDQGQFHDDDAVEIENSDLSDSGENAPLLPDMFKHQVAEEKPSSASIGGRLVLDEAVEEYTMDAVLGAEVTLEVKTN